MADTDTGRRMDSLRDADFMYIPEKSGKFTVKARQLNESLCELYLPKDRPPTMQVLFFHGFQREYKNAHLFTWTSGDDTGLWPQTWLVEKFPNAHILSVSYYEGKLQEILKKYKDQVDVDMSILIENLILDLQHAKIGQEPRCPVVLVGHSFGGLVVKQLCVNAFKQLGDTRIVDESRNRLLSFVDNIKGVFFYATPHHGIEDKSMKLLDPALLIPSGPLLEDVKILSKYAARLNGDFDIHLKQQQWRTAGLGESTPSNCSPSKVDIEPSLKVEVPVKVLIPHEQVRSLGVMFNLGRWSKGRLIVPEGSSRCYENFTIALGEDHISISRPKSNITRSFTAVETLLQEIGDDPQLFGRPGNWQYVPESVTGIEGVLRHVKHWLKTATKLGFVGMGGVGKTTLAMKLFNDLEHGYQYTCFIGDVKNLKGSPYTKVRDEMLERLHYGGKPRANKESGLGFLLGKRLLLVLDDVSSDAELTIVSALRDYVHKDSLFIATSRDSKPLTSHEVWGVPFRKFDVPFLSPESARKLFLTFAFPEKSIPSGFKHFVDGVDGNCGIVGKCGGFPLALEVIGKHLRGAKETIWDEALRSLEKGNKGVGFEDIRTVLQISYDGLSKEQKDMFLDACTVFYKEHLNIAMAAWSVAIEEGHQTSWRRLVQLSLVWEVIEGKTVKVGMHDQLLSLGRTVASTPINGHFHRIWNDSDEALRLLSENNQDKDALKHVIALKCSKGELKRHMGKSGARGITCTPQKRISISGKSLRNMTNLLYLWLEDIDIDQTHELELPFTPAYFHLARVNFAGYPFNPRDYYRVAVLKIIGCPGLRELPDSFLQLEGLEHIELIDTSLPSIPDVGQLTSLNTLILSWVPTAEFPSDLPDYLKQWVTQRDFPCCYTLERHEGKFVRILLHNLRKLNDSVYEFYSPPDGMSVSVEIIFFHGVERGDYSEAYFETWTSFLESLVVCWPQTLLAEKFRRARILSVSYDSSIEKGPRQGNLDLYITAENLVQDLIDDAKVAANPRVPVVLVGKDFGGLVIKAICMKAKEQNRSTFLSNLKGIFYYGTPHLGVENLSTAFNGALAKRLSFGNKGIARLGSDFSVYRKERKWKTRAIVSLHTSEKVIQKPWEIKLKVHRKETDGQSAADWFRFSSLYFLKSLVFRR